MKFLKKTNNDIDENIIRERVETLVKDEKVFNKKFNGYDSFYIFYINDSVRDDDNNISADSSNEPTVGIFKTPVLKERDLENNVNDRVNHDDINRLKAQFIALKSLVMNEIYGLKQEILGDVNF